MQLAGLWLAGLGLERLAKTFGDKSGTLARTLGNKSGNLEPVKPKCSMHHNPDLTSTAFDWARTLGEVQHASQL